jgi:hypothetical protein
MFTSIASLRQRLSEQSGVNRGISSCAVDDSAQFLAFLKYSQAACSTGDVALFRTQTTPEIL